MILKRLLLIVISLVAFTGCTSSSSTATIQNRIIYGLTLQPSGFDPHIFSSSELGIPLRQVYDTLVYRDPVTFEFVPGLATHWDISSDSLIYEFHLREGVKFHDNTDFNAQAVAANLDRITNPETQSQEALSLLGSYTQYEIVDDYTIRLILTEPYASFLDSLSQVYLGIASPTALAQYSNERYQFHQVGTGPYTFVEYVPGERLVIRRNALYNWGPEFYDPVTDASVEEIEFRFFTDPATRAIALQSGDVQVIGEILPTDARALVSTNTVQIQTVPIPGQPLQFMMNTQRYPTDNLAVRQALIYAANREAISDSIFQRYSPIAWGPISANSLFYDASLQGAYAFNSGQAIQLLESAGYSDNNNNGYVDFNGVDLEVTVIVPSWGLVPQVAEILTDNWRAIGVRTNIIQVPNLSVMRETVASGEYNLVAFYEFGVDPSYLSRYYSTGADYNWIGISNPELDAVLAQASEEIDPDVRADLYAQVQQFIMGQALILPIRDYVNLTGTRVNIQNLAFDAYGWFPLARNLTLVGE